MNKASTIKFLAGLMYGSVLLTLCFWRILQKLNTPQDMAVVFGWVLVILLATFATAKLGGWLTSLLDEWVSRRFPSRLSARLPEPFCSQQKACARAHNNSVAWLFLILIPLVFSLLAWLPLDRGTAPIIMLGIIFFGGFIGGLLLIERSDRRFSEQIGLFVRPATRASTNNPAGIIPPR